MLSKLFSALESTRTSIMHAFKNLSADKISDNAIEVFEEQLLLADVGLATVDSIIDILRKFSGDNYSNKIRAYLLTQLPEKYLAIHDQLPIVFMMVGVNGTGKTTSAA